jgi:hypothetical protein
MGNSVDVLEGEKKRGRRGEGAAVRTRTARGEKLLS